MKIDLSVIKKREIILFIFVFAIAVRFAYMAHYSLLNKISGDAIEYERYAVNILNGNGFRDGDIRCFRAPVWPYFMAGVYYLFGHSILALMTAQIVLSSLTCVFVYLLAMEVNTGKYAVLAGLYSCVYFAFVDSAPWAVSDLLFTFLLTIFFYYFITGKDNLWSMALSSFILGIATLTRSTTMVLPFFLVAWLFMNYGLKKTIKLSLVMFAVFGLTLLPWTIRNYRICHAIVPVNIMAGNVFFASNNPWSKGRANQQYPEYKECASLPGLSEVERDKMFFKKGKDWLKTLSGPQLLKFYFLKATTFIYPFVPEHGFKFDPTFGFIIPFWFAGMYLAVRHKNLNALLLLSLVIMSFINTLIFYGGETRFRCSYSPQMIIFGAMGMQSLESKLETGGCFNFAIGAWFAINVYIYFYSSVFYMFLQTIVR